MQQTKRRDPPAIRLGFRLLNVPRIRGTTAFAQFERLRHEVNQAAMGVMGTQSIGAYVSLLKEMDEWFQGEKRRGTI
jgi:hypothetical protein